MESLKQQENIEIKKESNDFKNGLPIALGTFIGAVSTEFIPLSLQDALVIAVYGMFIAIIVPAGRKDSNILRAIIISSALSIAFFYVLGLNKISDGFSIIICSLVGAIIMAKLKPIEDEENTSISKGVDKKLNKE